MLAPFAALLPRASGIPYARLEQAAKILRLDPASYQPAEGVEYRLTEPSLFLWQIVFDGGHLVEGLVGLFPLDRLVPHESTTPQAVSRSRHPVQIRPVMALTEESLPSLERIGPATVFEGDHRHMVTPVAVDDFEPPSAVIADGHHRVEAALREGGDPMIMTMLVSSDGTHLNAGAFHRVFERVSSLPAVLEGCEVVSEPPEAALAAGRIGVVSGQGSIGIDPTGAARQLPDLMVGLPAGLAARLVLPALGLAEHDARYMGDLAAALEASEAGTAVVLPPSQVSAVISAARTGVSLPPKATRFRPKPIRGFLMRPL